MYFFVNREAQIHVVLYLKSTVDFQGNFYLQKMPSELVVHFMG